MDSLANQLLTNSVIECYEPVIIQVNTLRL